MGTSGRYFSKFLHYFSERTLKMGKKGFLWPITPKKIFSRGIQDLSSESWRPGLSENVVLVAMLWLFKVGSKLDQNYANANAFFSDWNIFLMYPGYAIGKLTSRAFRKCGGFCCYNFLNPSYSRSKLGQILKKKSCRVKPYKKITRLQFCVSSFHIESASAQ